MRFHPVFDFSPDELAALRGLPTDKALAVAASTRDWVLDHRQLAALGVRGQAVTRRIGRCLLHRRHHGVYTVGRADLTNRGEARAALLRCGRQAVLSHRTAAWLLDLTGARGGTDVTTPTHRARLTPGARVQLHYTRRWEAGDVTWVDGLPCTSIERTLADLAAGTPTGEFERAWEAADRQTLLNVERLRTQQKRGRPGAVVLLDHLNR